MAMEAVSWNGGSGAKRDSQGRARTRIHFAEANHEVTICGVAVSAHEDAEVERRALPIAIKHSRSACNQCVLRAPKIGIKAFYDPARGEKF